MTDASSAQIPVTANFINPEAMHRPTGYTHVMEVTAGRPVYIAGQVALDRSGAIVGPGDIRTQARQVFDNLQAGLQAVGAGFEQVVKLPTTWWTPLNSPWFARSATSTSTSSSHRPAPPWRSGGWSAMTCSSRSKPLP
jgi:enamine deaminase RidA (YjgF/YER057c/UK114 family)